ncbi:MAG: glutathione peroxidase, partial [Stenotrophomonas sp.]
MHHVSLLSSVRRDRAPRRARWSLLLLAAGLLVGASAQAADLLDVSYRPLAGKGEVNLAKQYGGKVLLVVNTASKCGFTPQ